MRLLFRYIEYADRISVYDMTIPYVDADIIRFSRNIYITKYDFSYRKVMGQRRLRFRVHIFMEEQYHIMLGDIFFGYDRMSSFHLY
jgi:hypothetical protein